MANYIVKKPLRYEGKLYKPGKTIPLGSNVDTKELIKLEVIEPISKDDMKNGGESANPLNNGSKQEDGEAGVNGQMGTSAGNTTNGKAKVKTPATNPANPDSVGENGTKTPPTITPEGAGGNPEPPLVGADYEFLSAKEQLACIGAIEDIELLENLEGISKATVKTAIKKKMKTLQNQKGADEA